MLILTYMPYQSLEADLKRVGLSDKEAAVYVACLTLGPSTVLRISRKAGVARSTTYLILNSLIKQGLISTYHKGVKQYFMAEKPSELERLVHRQIEHLRDQEDYLRDLVPRLTALMSQDDSRPVVRYYEGKAGLRAMRSDMARVSESNDIWYNFAPMDYLKLVFGDEDFTYDKQRLARGIKSKTLFTTKSAKVKAHLLDSSDPRRMHRKFIDPKKYSSGTGITVLRDRVAVGTLEGKLGGFIVESASVATALREIFELLWETQGDK